MNQDANLTSGIFAVVILSKNADNVDACVRSIRAAGEDCPVVVVDDGVERERYDSFYPCAA